MRKFLLGFAMLVICCCRTYNGSCCAEVSICSGYIPGCFCTGLHPDNSEQSYGCRLNVIQGA